MPRNLVLCLDGTRNEPETGITNVVRAFDVTAKTAEQLLYYDPGVGTMGARSATTRVGKSLTVLSGLAMGHGIKENLEEAYTWLMRNWQRGDRIFIFGFSRGAYTALALGGMLRTLGLLRDGTENLVPYAVKLYTRSGKHAPGDEENEHDFWDTRDKFNRRFGNPHFNPFARRIDYLGIWDTVKTVGWLNARAKFVEAQWPFTRKASNVKFARHALAIDEKRRPYAPYRFDDAEVVGRKGALREMWFIGVHSDVGGFFNDDHALSDIALHWIIEGAIKAGLAVDPTAYRSVLGVDLGASIPEDRSLGLIHTNESKWWFAGPGWHHRVIHAGDEIHRSVHARIEATAGRGTPYRPRVPPT